ncbi:glycoside hydrolase superfamily [Lipomyces tetrasporus]|uniref:Glycoside hydrolase superfamily n=1 Tax=Lipomyces tetrasporus TaxID=54092 RepID=A0AAD7QVM5_9ASCO|nr:glycoside hydrolase superfamily [Lipomyces tetrasporus]KAJ8102153.1 glycoside hydrolase superfamily [Lipomyces tetrasporus]
MYFSSPSSVRSSRWTAGLTLLLGLLWNISWSDAAALPEIFYTTVNEPPVYVTVTSCYTGTTDVVVGTVTVTQLITQTNTGIAVATGSGTDVDAVTATSNDYVTASYVTTLEPTTTDFVNVSVSPEESTTSAYGTTSDSTYSTVTYETETTSVDDFSSSTEVVAEPTSTTLPTDSVTTAYEPSSYSTSEGYFEFSSSSSNVYIEPTSSWTSAEAGVTSTDSAEASATVSESSAYTDAPSSTTAEPTYETSSIESLSESSTYPVPSSSILYYASQTSSDIAGSSSSTISSEISSPTITTIPSEYASSTLTSSQDTTSTTTTLHTTITVTITWAWTTISTEFEDATSSSVVVSPTTSLPSTSTITTSMSLSTIADPATSTVEEMTSTSVPATTDSSSTPVSTIIPHALTYSPYTDSGNCKAAEEVSEDLAIIAAKGISTVRIYGTDCNSLSTVESAAEMYGLKLIQGLWIDSSGVDSIDSGVSDLISWGSSMDSHWNMISMIVVGNEAIFNGFVTVSDLLTKITSVRTQLRDAGYTGPITTAETPNVFVENPELCTSDSLDIVAINAQPYFDQYATPETAGQFDLDQIQLTKAACNSKDVFITETGFPSSGLTNYNNVPSVENQMIAIKNILEATDGNVTLFTMYNDRWKALGPYEVEQSFGMLHFIGS